MRAVTATEKYNAVLEGRMAKSEFVRQMRQEFPMFVSNFDGFDSTVNVLKTRNVLYETVTFKKPFQEAKVYTDRPALTYSLDSLDRGIRVELNALGIELPHLGVSPEDYLKAETKAKDNLEKDPNHYINLLSGESSNVDKHDREVEVKRGAADKDTFNDLKKATLKENMYIDDEEWEKEMGRTPEDTEKAIDKEASKLEKEGATLTENLAGILKHLKAKYGDIPGINTILIDFAKMHGKDILAGADPETEFENYIDANYDRLNEKKGKDHDGDGDIDGDDYKAAKDKAIKKAMGKQDQLKEAIKNIIKKTLTEEVVNEAATAKLSDWGEGYDSFEGVKSVVNDLENIVTEVEQFYDKISVKIAKVMERTADFKNEEGLNIGAFIAPSLEAAFRQDLKPVIKKGFLDKVELPKVRTISQADIDAHNSGETPLGESEPKQTMFTPVNENKK